MMSAIRLHSPGSYEVLTPTKVPKPNVQPGWLRIQVKAFGVNESELISRRASRRQTLPTRASAAANASASSMPSPNTATDGGAAGRDNDGRHGLQYRREQPRLHLVRDENAVPFASDLPWRLLGEVPEIFQTAYGSLHTGLALAGQASDLPADVFAHQLEVVAVGRVIPPLPRPMPGLPVLPGAPSAGERTRARKAVFFLD